MNSIGLLARVSIATLLLPLANQALAEKLGTESCTNGNCGTYTFSTPVAITTSEINALTVMGGNVGFGTIAPLSPLSVNGVIESQAGGFKFPDGTTQITAATSGTGGSSQWITSGSDIKYNVGNVGIGLGAGNVGYLLDVGSPSQPGQYVRISGLYSTGFLIQNGANGSSYGIYSGSAAANGFDGLAVFDGTAYRFQIMGTGSDIIALNANGGNVGIGTITPGYVLDVAGDLNSSSALRVAGTSVCTSTGCTSASDERLKENIEPLENDSLSKINSLKPVRYKWKDKAKYGKKSEIGFVAQDLEKIYPELVKTDGESGMKSVDYGKLTAPLVLAVQQIEGELRTQRAEIELLRQENRTLKEQIRN